MLSLQVKTPSRTCLVDITSSVRKALRELGIKNGAVQVFVPHTTAGVTINENADPAVPSDILARLEALVPPEAGYRHMEGNSDAHIKTLMTGSSTFVPVKDGELVLGTWQAVFFAEYDGPRNRKVLLNPLGG
jgi:secondary thiamine-phosphate synthase enzyme